MKIKATTVLDVEVDQLEVIYQMLATMFGCDIYNRNLYRVGNSQDRTEVKILYRSVDVGGHTTYLEESIVTTNQKLIEVYTSLVTVRNYLEELKYKK